MMGEISGNHGLHFDFGSYHHNVTHKNAGKYYADLAIILIGRMVQNESIMIKTFMRQQFNYDALYYNQYEPLFAEAKLWK